MKNNLLKVFAIVIICLFSVSLLNNSYATSVCTIKGFFSPSNPQPGQEVTIDVSASQINEGIAGVQFTLDYEAEKFELISATPTSEWDLTQTESLIVLMTKTSEVTTNTGTLATIKLKVKDDASLSTTSIKLTNIAVTTDDSDLVTIGEISQDITITSKQGQQENSSSESNNTPTNVVPNNNNTNQNNSYPIDNNVDANKIVVVNGNSSNGSSAKNADSSSATKTLPKTGNAKVLPIIITIGIITLGVGITSYKKYNNIK